MHKHYSSIKISNKNDDSLEYEKNNDRPCTPSQGLIQNDALAVISKGYDRKFAIKAALIASIGGLIFGYDIGVVAGALGPMKKDFNLSDVEQEFVVSTMFIGAFFGAIIGGFVTDFFGRWNAIIGTCFLFILGAFLLSFAPTIGIVYFGRVIVGISVALSAIADVSYLTEVSPPTWRGAIVSSNEFMITVGVLLSYLCDYWLQPIEGGWRWMFGISAAFAVIQLIGMKGMPESPKWLMTQKREEEAMEALMHIYQCKLEAEEEKKRILSYPLFSTSKTGLSTLFKNWRIQFIIALLLMVFQQFSGHGNILNYAPKIFEKARMPMRYSASSTVVLGAVKVLITGLALLLVDKLGRRLLLILGVLLMMLSLIFLGLTFHFINNDNDTLAVLVVIECSVFIAAYAIGFGPISWLLVSEMFPVLIRGRAIGIATVVNWGCNVIVSATFLTIVDKLGIVTVFFMFSLICLIAFLFVLAIVPETLHKDPDHIAIDLQNKLQRYCCFS